MTKFLMLLLVLAVSSCGFTPRGYLNPSQSPPLAAVDIASDDVALTQALKRQFTLLGMQTVNDAQSDVKLTHVELQRYQLAGVLSEVRLVLSAKASYAIDGVWHTYPIVVSKSYQHNKANLSVDDSEGEQALKWLQQTLASRVAEQYHALHP